MNNSQDISEMNVCWCCLVKKFSKEDIDFFADLNSDDLVSVCASCEKDILEFEKNLICVNEP